MREALLSLPLQQFIIHNSQLFIFHSSLLFIVHSSIRLIARRHEIRIIRCKNSPAGSAEVLIRAIRGIRGCGNKTRSSIRLIARRHEIRRIRIIRCKKTVPPESQKCSSVPSVESVVVETRQEVHGIVRWRQSSTARTSAASVDCRPSACRRAHEP